MRALWFTVFFVHGKHSPLKILIVDDDARLRARMVRLCSEQLSRAAIFEASSGLEAIELATLHVCDVVVMDIHMSGMSGLNALRALKQLRLPLSIIIVSALARDPYEAAALKHGAFAFLSKDLLAQELVGLIVAAAAAGNNNSGSTLEMK